MPGRPAIRAPPVRTHGPTRCTSPARTHAALQQARGQAGPFWTDPACQRRPRRRGVCVPRRRPRPGTDHGHLLAQQLRVRPGQRTRRVWLCAISRKKTARARRGRTAHTHVAGRLPPCAPVWNDGTNARSARHPPQKQHTRWQPSSMRASRPRPARRLRRRARRPRRVAGASPLPVDTQMHSEQRRAKRSDCGNAFPLRWPADGIAIEKRHFRGNAFPLRWPQRKCNLESFSLRFLFERNRFPGDSQKHFGSFVPLTPTW